MSGPAICAHQNGATPLESEPDRAEALARSLAAEVMLQPDNHYVDVAIAGDLETLSDEQGTVRSPRLDGNLVQAHEQYGRATASWIADEGVPCQRHSESPA